MTFPVEIKQNLNVHYYILFPSHAKKWQERYLGAKNILKASKSEIITIENAQVPL